jgi:hypothetical protein
LWDAPGDNGSGITGYRVQRSTDSGATWVDTATTTSTSYSAWNSVNGTSYIGRVQAYNPNGNGAYSAASTARTPAFASSGTISASQNPVTAPVYRDTDNALLVNGVGPGGGARPYTVSFNPPDVAGFLRSRIYAKFDFSDWRQVGSDISVNTADTLGVSHIPDSTWFDIPVAISNYYSNVSFFMRTYNSDESSIDTAVVSYTAEGYKYYYTYDTTNQSTTTGYSSFDYNTYQNAVGTGAKDGDTWIIQVVAQASNDVGPLATIATSSRNFFVRYYLGTSYPSVTPTVSSLWTSKSGTNQDYSWWNNSGTTLRNGTIQANAVPAYTGLRLQVSGAGSLVSGWSTSTRVRFVITYRNRYTNYW